MKDTPHSLGQINRRAPLLSSIVGWRGGCQTFSTVSPVSPITVCPNIGALLPASTGTCLLSEVLHPGKVENPPWDGHIQCCRRKYQERFCQIQAILPKRSPLFWLYHFFISTSWAPTPLSLTQWYSIHSQLKTFNPPALHWPLWLQPFGLLTLIWT